MFMARPVLHIPKPFQPTAHGLVAQTVLMTGVVVDDPLPPERCQCIQIQHAPAPTGMRLHRSCRGGIKTNPSVVWEICFNPRVGIARSNQVLRSEIVELSGAESVDYARGDTERAQHNCHRGSEVLAVSLFAFEEKIGDGIARDGTRKLQG